MDINILNNSSGPNLIFANQAVFNMKFKAVVVLITIFVVVSLFAMAADVWRTKSDESYVTFEVNSTFGHVDGKIPGIEATIVFSENDLENSSFNATNQPKNLDTDNKKRDKHLRSDDYLDVERFPLIRFVSKKIEKTDQGFSVTGDLTIKETTKEITFPFTFENQGNRGIFKGKFDINRTDYHVGGQGKMAGHIIKIGVVTVVEK
jgi:polyisoprenoid-binding protein YceI